MIDQISDATKIASSLESWLPALERNTAIPNAMVADVQRSISMLRRLYALVLMMEDAENAAVSAFPERTPLQQDAVNAFREIGDADATLVYAVPNADRTQVLELDRACGLLLSAQRVLETLMHEDDRPE